MPQENNRSEGKSNDTGKRLPGQNSLMIRILVGGYLLYLSYSLLDGFINGSDMNKYILGAFMVAFAVIGVLLIIFSGQSLYQGKYIGGKMDPETQDETEDREDEDEEQADHGDEDQTDHRDGDQV